MGEEIPLYQTYDLENVYLVEPIKSCEKIIQEKVKELGNFTSFNIALGSNDSISKLYVADGEDSGSSSLLAPRESEITFSNLEEITVKKFTSLGLENIDMVVIDTQGYELEVLKGFESYINAIPCFIIEFANYEGYLKQPVYKDLNLFMRKKGFVPIAQIKRINKPFPNINGGSFGDALYVDKKLLRNLEIIFFTIKYYLINLIIYDAFIYSKKRLKKRLKRYIGR
tara:strand:+ start:1728 stop:2405 length:678 start_codon:yes stop_codon:yes gene_type:complete